MELWVQGRVSGLPRSPGHTAACGCQLGLGQWGHSPECPVFRVVLSCPRLLRADADGTLAYGKRFWRVPPLCGKMPTYGQEWWAQVGAGSDFLALFLISVAPWALKNKAHPTWT